MRAAINVISTCYQAAISVLSVPIGGHIASTSQAASCAVRKPSLAQVSICPAGVAVETRTQSTALSVFFFETSASSVLVRFIWRGPVSRWRYQVARLIPSAIQGLVWARLLAAKYSALV